MRCGALEGEPSETYTRYVEQGSHRSAHRSRFSTISKTKFVESPHQAGILPVATRSLPRGSCGPAEAGATELRVTRTQLVFVAQLFLRARFERRLASPTATSSYADQPLSTARNFSKQRWCVAWPYHAPRSIEHRPRTQELDSATRTFFDFVSS